MIAHISSWGEIAISGMREKIGNRAFKVFGVHSTSTGAVECTNKGVVGVDVDKLISGLLVCC